MLDMTCSEADVYRLACQTQGALKVQLAGLMSLNDTTLPHMHQAAEDTEDNVLTALAITAWNSLHDCKAALRQAILDAGAVDCYARGQRS